MRTGHYHAANVHAAKLFAGTLTASTDPQSLVPTLELGASLTSGMAPMGSGKGDTEGTRGFLSEELMAAQVTQAMNTLTSMRSGWCASLL